MKKCKKCGGTLVFDPNHQHLVCEKCKEFFPIRKVTEFKKYPFIMEEKTKEENIGNGKFNTKCPNCGANFGGETFSISERCKYCGGHLVMDGENSPDGIIPFAFGIEEAKVKFREGLKKKWFLPNKLKRKHFDNIESVYIPAYLCDISTFNSYRGKIYDEYRESDGDVSRSYRKISGVKDVTTENLMVECSSRMTQVTLNDILPYNAKEVCKFLPEYVMGYSVEYYDKILEDCKKNFKAMATANIRKEILKNYSYDGVDYLEIDTKYYDCKYSRVVLPTYNIKYKYRKKQYSTYMNGQTGKVGKNIPRSQVKIFAFIMGIVAGIGIFACLLFLLFRG